MKIENSGESLGLVMWICELSAHQHMSGDSNHWKSEKGRWLRKKPKALLHLRSGKGEELAKEAEKNSQRSMRRKRKNNFWCICQETMGQQNQMLQVKI